MTPEARFWAKVNKDGPVPVHDPSLGPCWLWTAAVRDNGYPLFWNEGRLVSAYRFSYELENGPIPEGLTIDHLCRTPLCVNHAHLEAVTQHVNNLRGNGWSGRNARKTHCKRGHEFTPENTGLNHYPRHVQRYCRTCVRDAQRRARSAA